MSHASNIRIDEQVEQLIEKNPVYDPLGAKLSKTKTLKYYLIQGVQAVNIERCKGTNFAGAAGHITSAKA